MSLRRSLQRSLCLLWMLLPAHMAAADAPAEDLIERFATIETVWDASISPDGKRVALGCSTEKGLRAACVFTLDSPNAKPVVITSAPGQRIEDILWAQPHWLLLHVSNHDNVRAITNNLSFVRIDRLIAHHVLTGRSSVLLEKNAPLALDLTDVAATPAGWPDEIIMRGPTNFFGEGAYRVNLATGKGKLLERFQSPTLNVLFDGEGNPVLEQQYDLKKQQHRLVRRKDGSTVALKVLIQDNGYAPDVSKASWVGFTQGGNKLAGMTYLDNGTFQPLLFDLSSRTSALADPELENVNVDGWIADVSSDAVVGVYYTTDVPRQRFYDEALERARLAISKALPGQNVLLTSWTRDRKLVTVQAAPPGMPKSYYLFDDKQRSLSPLGAAHPLLQELPAATTRSVQYTARDGLKIEAFLTLPPGKDEKQGPFPLLLMPHGGPLERDDASFQWHVHFFAHRGYAVLQPNFRGSDGYGLAFRKKGYGEFGGAMIDDIIDGAHFAIAGGIADRDRICSIGASYGGYAALMVALREPGLVKCTISIAGVTDPTAIFGERLKLFDENSSVMRFWESYIGSRYRDRQAVIAASPVRRAREIRVPVLLIHGEDDLNVPVGQSRHLKKEMELYNRKVKYVELEGTDHYFTSTAARHVLLAESDAFLTQYLGAEAPE